MSEQELLNRIAELEQQKKDLSVQIEQLKNSERFSGNCKFGVDRYDDGEPFNYYFSVNVPYKHHDGSQWKSLVNETSLEEAIAKLHIIINNLLNILSQLEATNGKE